MPETTNKRKQELPVPAAAEEPRIGVYICNCGGNIGDVVQCQRVAKTLETLPNVVVSRTHLFMCSDPGQELITEDVKEKGVNRVVVGACSPFLHEQTFRGTMIRAGLNPYLYNHVGLREQNSWVHHGSSEEATEKAIRLVSAGIAKARLLEPLEQIRLTAEKHALVIGGGIAGLRSAWDIARRGLRVTLIEKSPFLGGRMAQLEKVFPTGENAQELLHGLMEKVSTHPNITIYTQAEVINTKGSVGNFQIQIRQHSRGVNDLPMSDKAIEAAIAACPEKIPDEFNYGLTTRKAIYRPYKGCYPAAPAIDWKNCTACEKCLKASGNGGISLKDEPKEFEITVGAVVMATGFKPYEPPEGEYGYGLYPEVITLPQLERILSPGGPTGGSLEWGGRPIRNVAMIHCVGSRQVEGINAPQPDGEVNTYCSRVCCTATLHAANEIRERFPEVNIFDLYQDIRTYGHGHEAYYLNASKKRVVFLCYTAEEPPEVVRAPEGEGYPLLVKVKDRLTWGEEIEMPVDLVVLTVGMLPGPVDDLISMLNITRGNDRFLLEVHPKLRPVETSVPGIVLAGTAQGPMSILESSAAASAAASKVAVLLSQGQVELEPFVARVNQAKCDGAGECVKICFGDAIHMVEVAIDGQMVQRATVNPANCQGCGACVGACPNRAIDLLGWTLDQYEAMVDALVAELPVLEVEA